MFDRYIILEQGFRNVVADGQVIGFTLGVRLPYYRGLGLSMIEDVVIVVDGEVCPRESLRVMLHGNTYTLDEMEFQTADRWEFGEVGTVTVLKPGGCSAGEHRIEVEPRLRLSYFPSVFGTKDSKTLRLE